MLSPNKAAVALSITLIKDAHAIVVASGHGPVADKIIEVADQNGVPIFRDDSTAAVLTMLNVGQQIPESLYEVIAGIYVEILKATNELKRIILKSKTSTILWMFLSGFLLQFHLRQHQQHNTDM